MSIATPTNGHAPGAQANPKILISTTSTKLNPGVAPSHGYIPSRDTPGQLPEDVYNAILPWWRTAIRAHILKAVARESPVLARMQARLRSPWLDKYFLYTSSLGTHTFFMIALPLLFFFGYGETGRGLVVVLASGVYFSSFIKDLVCSPRPFAPPVSRLTIGTHHLEYGFPSTHSTNSVSMALFIFSQVHSAYSEHSAISDVAYQILCAILALYAVSIVFGRLYTGMHSFTDCGVGVTLGAAIWAAYVMMSDELESWLESGLWSVPYTLVPACLLLVHYHPQPVDDCPCFEDAIAFVSVILGVLLARWHSVYVGLDEMFLHTVMPGGQGGVWTWEGKVQWWSTAGAKMGIGILIIFVWRLLAKSVLHAVLPPVFRALAQCFKLPHRRFYTPATDYNHLPVENGLHPIPSVIDLNGVMEVSGVNGGEYSRDGVKRRGRNGVVKFNSNVGQGLEDGKFSETEKSWAVQVQHYDADVLTKVVVYAGIGMLSAEGIAVLFSLMGWGVKPW
ncbi:acid phosphatase/Vanadium-dependent haloperoxidase [Paxillus ammoniavirescens]|nr:acid phosphatase/Vanadium-dependent haloperoxidase [Paxillus ammoniavirescens]